MVTVRRQDLVTETLAGMDLGGSTASDRTTRPGVTDTRRVAVTDRLAMGPRQDMGQALLLATALALAAPPVLVLATAPVLVPATAQAQVLALFPATAPAEIAALATAALATGEWATARTEGSSPLAAMGRAADTEAMAAGPALMRTGRVMDTGREMTTALVPGTGRVTARDQTLVATVLALAMHRAVLVTDQAVDTGLARRSYPALATGTARETGQIVGITRTLIRAMADARPASTTARATAMTCAIGMRMVIRAAVTDTAKPMPTGMGRRGRAEAATRRTGTTSGVFTASAMSTGHRTTTGETKST